jgi:hypothetical protein
VVFVRQSAPATDGDQPRITLFREDWHTPIPTIDEATDRVPNALFALGSAGLIGRRTSRDCRMKSGTHFQLSR